MSTLSISPVAESRTHSLSRAGRIALLSFTVLFALALYYFIGVDQGMSSVFGKTTVLHEWVHDSRHFLGFPCH